MTLVKFLNLRLICKTETIVPTSWGHWRQNELCSECLTLTTVRAVFLSCPLDKFLQTQDCP